MIIEPLKANYGDGVAINYYDVGDANLHPDIKKLIEEHNLPVPLTFINGESVSAGYISYYDLTRRLDKLFTAE